MANEQRVLKQDGYLEVGTTAIDDIRTFYLQPNHGPLLPIGHYGQSKKFGQLPMAGWSCRQANKPIETRNIVYHPHLNVILVMDNLNQVKIVDVHSGVILQSYKLAPSDSK